MLDGVGFLQSFNHSLYTFQIFKNGKPYEALTRKSDELERFLGKAKEAQEKGNYEYFFTPNEGDGIIYPGNKIPRSQENIRQLCAAWIDTDHAPWPQVKSFLDEKGLKPSAVVNTSPGKYHVYFMLSEKVEATTANVRKWQAIQKALAQVPGSDQSMGDYAKVLRVPDLQHLKNPLKPHVIRLVFHSDAKYTLDELSKVLNCREAEREEKPPYEIKNEPIPEGSRHAEMTAFLGHMLTLGNSKEVSLLAFKQYAKEKFTNSREWLPGGGRFGEVESFIDWKLKDLEKEKQKAQIEISECLLNRKESGPSFDLPDDFYFKAPGLAGEIAQEISESARYPIPAFAFAAAVAALGALRPHRVSSLDHPAASYFLCLAPTGSGKNFAQDVLSHTFSKLGVAGLLSTGIPSAKGLARHLEINHSQGILSLDEAEGFFEALNDQKSPSYLKQCKGMLLETYTACNNPRKSLGQLANIKDKPIVLSYPRLNLLAHGVLNSLETAFDRKAISDGLLQRFVVLTSFKERHRNPQAKNVGPLNGNIYGRLEAILKDTNSQREAILLESADLEADIRAAEKANKEKLAESLKAKLQSLMAEKVRFKRIPFTPEALKLYNDYMDFCDAKVNEELTKGTGLEGIFTRAAEQVGRLAIAMGDNEIGKDLIDYLIRFLNSRTDALYSLVTKDTFETKGRIKTDQQELNLLLGFIAGRVKETGKAVSYRDIARIHTVRDFRKLKELLAAAVEIGELAETSQKNKKGRDSKLYSLCDVL